MTNQTRKPVMLMIMDGWGIAEASDSNAITLANTPVYDDLIAKRPNTAIEAHGNAVGLPKGQMGNSEVGHLNLGAGRIVKQDLMRINESIETKEIFKNPAFTDAASKIKAAGGKAHVMGLCSPGGVHSALPHMYAVIEVLKSQGLDVYLHAITDGRDTPPSSAKGYLEEIEEKIAGKARVATVVGRFWAMDRDNRWERVSRGYHAFVAGEGDKFTSVKDAVEASYKNKKTDEFIEPSVITDENGTPIGSIDDGDGVIFFNFRADRAREITSALAFDDFDGFERKKRAALSSYVCMTEYQADFGLPVAYPPESLNDILGKVLEDHNMTQFRCAETEKYAHVTFFFNGGEEEPFKNEERKLIPSPKEVATYDLKPQMSAELVGDAVVDRIENGNDDFILVNFANPDMVGHTGFIEAAVAAIEAVDKQLGRVCDAILKKGGALLVTADHGNSEQMRDPVTGEPHTAHTNNPVPLILVDDTRKDVKMGSGGSLRDVAPTVLELIGLDKPAAMTGKSLIIKG
ncbi:MAG: 2,3-bisphosphoglycerate-independent phosphoglycerate mutase [Deltaproteobacteria bacterium]|nr:2,3-bisphosphoglycerate-independent phosphoglycerate mutase [Deltaproteobacteria bacterium]